MRGGFRRFPFTGFEKLGSQSDLPGDVGQSPRPPFDPRKQPDIFNPYRTSYAPNTQQQETPTGVPEQLLDVRHIFDSRPVFAYDFYWEEQFFEGIRQAEAFRVPDGLTYVLRQVGVEIFRTSFNAAGTSGYEMGGWGGIQVDLASQSPLIPKLQITVDGVPTPQWTPFSQVTDPTSGESMQGVPLFSALISQVQLETFIIVPGGSTFSIFIPDFISVDSTPPTMFEFSTLAQYQGVALQAGGSDARLDIANQTPLPVTGS